MFSLSIQNINLSIVFLLLVSNIIGLDFKFPTEIVGTFDNSLYLKTSSSRGFTLSHQVSKGGSFNYTWHLNEETNNISINVSSLGTYFIDINDNSKALDSTDWSTSTLVYSFPKKVSKLELEVTFLRNHPAQLEAITLNSPSHAFDENYRYVKAKPVSNNVQLLKYSPYSTPFGVNLEAEYLFSELSFRERRNLLGQLVRDGFNSIRLHKLFREHQRSDSNLFSDLEAFLNICHSMNIKVYLDILSYPRQVGDIDGWKQIIFLDKELQLQMEDWIRQLSFIKVNKVSLFQWQGLKYICLVNENSLFFEDSKKSIRDLNRVLLEERSSKWISRKSLKHQLMSRFYTKFANILSKLGYKNQLFLSNYQLGATDLEINESLSKEVDRHLYLDYPIFYKGIVKVKNENPIENLDKLRKHYLSISPESGTYLSEFNLPWPNRFQHTLIPILLYLNKVRALKGIWFYDYRLRSKDFHSGGIFGIQKFRSIIHQIPYWFELNNDNYSTSFNEGTLKIQSRNYSALIGSKFAENTNYHFAAWRECKSKKLQLFSIEKANDDMFDKMGQIQKRSGGAAMKLTFPSVLIHAIEKSLVCP